MTINLFDSATFKAQTHERIARWAKGIPADYTYANPAGYPLAPQLCQFHDVLSGMAWIVVGPVDTQTTLAELLDRKDTKFGTQSIVQQVTVEKFAHELGLIADFIFRCAMDDGRTSQICTELNATVDAVQAAVKNTKGTPEKVMEIVRQELGDQKLEAFYFTTPMANGFLRWDKAFILTAEGAREHHHETTPGGEADFYVTKYKTNEPYSRLMPYEWHASLMAKQDQQYLAIACGMVYTARRPQSRARIGGNDLLIAADEATDVDVLQVSAFLKQHQDAREVLHKGDIAFVWLWERHDGRSVKGDGTTCIQLALTQLIKRFPDLSTVVIDLKPYQHQAPGEFDEPPSIQMKRLEALDTLQAHVDSVMAQCPLDVRYMCNREVDPLAALRQIYEDKNSLKGAVHS